MDRLRLGPRRPLPWPLRRLRPRPPVPQPQPNRRRFALGVAAAACSLTAVLAVTVGHVTPYTRPTVPPGDVVGYVVGVTGSTVIAQYSPPGQPSANDLAVGTGKATDGQSVVVRPAGASGTIVSMSVPSPRIKPGFVAGTVVFVAFAALMLRLCVRLWTALDRSRARDEETDYRDDEWAGTSYSA